MPHLHVHRAEHVVKRGAGVEFLRPSLDAREIVALQSESHIHAAGEFLAGRGHEFDVAVELLRRHAVVDPEPVG